MAGKRLLVSYARIRNENILAVISTGDYGSLVTTGSTSKRRETVSALCAEPTGRTISRLTAPPLGMKTPAALNRHRVEAAAFGADGEYSATGFCHNKPAQGGRYISFGGVYNPNHSGRRLIPASAGW